MLKRTFSTLALWSIIAVALIFWGAPALFWLLTILAILTQTEFYRLLKKMGHFPISSIGLLFGSLMMLSSWYGPKYFGLHPLEGAVGVLCLSVITLSLILLLFSPSESIHRNPLMPTLFGILYVPFMLQFYVQIFSHYENAMTGLMLTIWVIAVAKFTDVGGLLVGSKLGRRKLAPLISPGKTWEGALGGLLTALGVSCIIFFTTKSLLPENFTLAMALIMAIPVSLISILSDLVQSVIKRQANTKDSGYVIPGIGGAFDLTDSLILCAPLAYYLFKFTLF